MRLCGCGTLCTVDMLCFHEPLLLRTLLRCLVCWMANWMARAQANIPSGIQGVESDKQVVLGAVLQGKTDERVAQVVAAALADAAVAKVRLPHRRFPLIV